MNSLQNLRNLIAIDWMVDLRQAVETLDRGLVCGNLDPVAVFLYGSEE